MKIIIAGAGSWGLALARLLKDNQHEVALWDHYPNVLDSLRYDESFELVYDIQNSLSEFDLLITVIPTQAYSKFFESIKDSVHDKLQIINCSKGIEIETGRFVSNILTDTIKHFSLDRYFVLSGPSFALEVMEKQPTAVVLAGQNKESLAPLQSLFCNEWFRVYGNTDYCGVEIAGSMKNVIAISAGIINALGYGINTLSALITRGNAEIVRLGLALGGHLETFYGLSGIGDLMLTSMSNKSRNYQFGYYIGQGLSPAQAKEKIKTVIEGYETVKAAISLSKKLKIELPITEKIYEVLYNNLHPLKAIKDLMMRNLRNEA